MKRWEACHRKGMQEEIFDSHASLGCHNKVLAFVLLIIYEPESPYKILSMSPVSYCVDVAEL
jgi:hypothetical protein